LLNWSDIADLQKMASGTAELTLPTDQKDDEWRITPRSVDYREVVFCVERSGVSTEASKYFDFRRPRDLYKDLPDRKQFVPVDREGTVVVTLVREPY
jgi:hypothetical protein